MSYTNKYSSTQVIELGINWCYCCHLRERSVAILVLFMAGNYECSIGVASSGMKICQLIKKLLEVADTWM